MFLETLNILSIDFTMWRDITMLSDFTVTLTFDEEITVTSVKCYI